MQNQATTATLWIVWFFIFSGLFVIQFFLGGGIPTGGNTGPLPMPIMAAGAGAFLVSVVIRWFLIPRTAKGGPTRLMPVMIAGIAIAEMVCFLGIFLLPDTVPQLKLAFFITSVIGVAQFAPIYASQTD